MTWANASPLGLRVAGDKVEAGAVGEGGEEGDSCETNQAPAPEPKRESKMQSLSQGFGLFRQACSR